MRQKILSISFHVVSALGEKFRAIGERHFLEAKNLQAVFRPVPHQDDLIAWLQCIPVPARRSRQNIRTIHLALPVLDAAVIFLDVQRNFDMWIAEVKVRDSTFDGNQLGRVVARGSVVSESQHRTKMKNNSGEESA